MLGALFYPIAYLESQIAPLNAIFVVFLGPIGDIYSGFGVLRAQFPHKLSSCAPNQSRTVTTEDVIAVDITIIEHFYLFDLCLTVLTPTWDERKDCAVPFDSH